MGGKDKAFRSPAGHPKAPRKKDKGTNREKNDFPLSGAASIAAFRMEFASTHAALNVEQNPTEEDEWTWESYTPESSEENLKKAKGKKGKPKPKKPKIEKKEVAVVEEEEQVDDFMLTLLGIKPPEDKDEVQEEEAKMKKTKPPKPKPPKIGGKKMSKKELQDYLALLEAEAALAAEEERLRALEEKKIEVEREKRETVEQVLRNDQLAATMTMIANVENQRLERALVARKQHQWETYVKEDGMPNLYCCGDLTTYLHHWENAMKTISVDNLCEKIIDAMFLMESIQQLIEDPVGARDLDVENWKWVNGMFREYLAKSLEIATYRQLSNIASNMTRIDVHTAKYCKVIEHFGIFLWLRLVMPPSKPNPKKESNLPQIDLPISQLRIRVILPQSLECIAQAIRVLYLAYDHISDLCATFAEPPVPEPFAPPLVHVMQQEWYAKLYYKWLNREIPEGEKPDKKLVVDKEKGIIPIVPWIKLEPSASEHELAEEEQLYLDIKERLRQSMDDGEINLRQYLVIGGVFCINIYYQLAQPQRRVLLDVTVNRVQLPREIYKAPFHETYQPPPPLNRAKFKLEKDYLAEVEKRKAGPAHLIKISVALPVTALWLDDPIVCFWDLAKSAWTTADIHEVAYDEKVQGYTFFTGRLGCFSFAVNRYASFPFEYWEMKPEDGGLNFKLVTRILTFVFVFKADKITILNIANAPGTQLNSYIGVPMTLSMLIRTLKKHGVDIFPAFDAVCYVENSCEKHWPMERHTYDIMGQMSGCFHLCWSQWNKSAGRRALVFRIKEFKATRRPFLMTMVTPLNAMFIDCAENADEFYGEPVEGTKFYADLHQLIRGSFSMAIKAEYLNTNPQLSRNVAGFLAATRIFSFA